MAIKIYDVIKKMETIAPLDLALSWDNVGLQVGDSNWETKKILLAMDATNAVIDEAKEKGCNLIITHHPILFKPIRKINNDTCTGIKILNLIQNRMAVYSAHTNLDLVPNGVDDLFAQNVGIQLPSPLPQSEEGKSVGRFGELEKEQTLDEFIQVLKHNLGIDAVTIAGHEIKTVKKIATVCGSGMSYVKLAKSVGADVFVTGDLKYHDGQMAEELGITIIDVTHFNSEKFILPFLQKELQETFNELEVVISSDNGNLFKRR